MGLKNQNRKKGKKKRKLKVHYDRLIFQLVLLSAITFFVVWGINKCVGEEYDNKVNVEAVEAAKRDAARALSFPKGSMERSDALLYIKSQESKLRTAGYGHAADDYIETARDLLNGE